MTYYLGKRRMPGSRTDADPFGTLAYRRGHLKKCNAVLFESPCDYEQQGRHIVRVRVSGAVQ